MFINHTHLQSMGRHGTLIYECIELFLIAQSLEETEDYSLVLYWMCCVINSMRAVVSPDPVDDNLAEVYIPLDEDSFLTVAMSDMLFINLSKLSIHSSTKMGMVAFHKLVLQMTHFVVLLKSLIALSFESKSNLLKGTYVYKKASFVKEMKHVHIPHTVYMH